MANEQTPTMPADADLFRDAMAPPAPPPAEPPAEPQAQPPPAQATPPAGYDDRPRDERGRFVPAAEAPQAPPQPPPQPPQAPAPGAAPGEDDRTPAGHRWAQMREELAAQKAQNQELQAALYDLYRRVGGLQAQPAAPPQAPPPPPDPWADPQGYANYIERRNQEGRRMHEANISFRLAHAAHGERFAQAYSTMIALAERGQPQLAQAIMDSPDPGASLVNWYNQEMLKATVGNDPYAWAEKHIDERIEKDDAYAGRMIEKLRARAQRGQQANGSPVNIPPSLSTFASSAPPNVRSGDMSDQSLFDFAFRQGRSPR